MTDISKATPRPRWKSTTGFDDVCTRFSATPFTSAPPIDLWRSAVANLQHTPAEQQQQAPPVTATPLQDLTTLTSPDFSAIDKLGASLRLTKIVNSHEQLVAALEAAGQKFNKVIWWLEQNAALQDEAEKSYKGQFPSLADASRRDAKNLRDTAADVRKTRDRVEAALAAAKPSPANSPEVAR